MKQYLDLVQEVLDRGTRKENRTGVDTISAFNINYSINGSIYLGFINNFLKNMNFFEYNCLAFKMNRTNSIDIDTIFDFKLAEKYLKKIKKI